VSLTPLGKEIVSTDRTFRGFVAGYQPGSANWR
jgi:hypothetical protein